MLQKGGGPVSKHRRQSKHKPRVRALSILTADVNITAASESSQSKFHARSRPGSRMLNFPKSVFFLDAATQRWHQARAICNDLQKQTKGLGEGRNSSYMIWRQMGSTSKFLFDRPCMAALYQNNPSASEFSFSSVIPKYIFGLPQ